MNIKNIFSFAMLCLICSVSATAQTATQYVVHVGTADDVEAATLGRLSDIGNVYFNPLPNGEGHEIVLGAFNDLSKAEAVIQNLKNKNFTNAYAAPLPTTKGKEVHVIQLVQFSNHEQLSWGKYQGLGKIYSTIGQGQIKLVVGIFPDYQASLPMQDDLYQAGFTTAQVVKVNSIFLHEVNLADIAFQQNLQTRPIGQVSEFTAKGGATIAPKENASMPSITARKEATPPIVGRISLPKSIAPAINESLARNAVKNLQSILSVYGTYNVEPNGKYDDKTANAYYATVQLNPTLKKYSAQVEQKNEISSGYFTDWNDIQLLMSISESISGQKINFGDAELKALVSLYTQPKVLGSEDAKTVEEWRVKLTNTFQTWQSTNKLDSETHKAYLLVSNKTQVLLEDYFLNKGFALTESTDLAKATMYALLIGNYPNI